MKYAIIDIETTGNKATVGKITEIAIYVHDGHKVVDEFISLVNPECYISPFITQLTGITNEMVSQAPKFYEIAKKVVDITEGAIFVAHNSGFDYSFVQAEFEALGYSYQRETLCTVKLSRQLIPGHKSYSLGNICEYYNIAINGRHRAAGDALATVSLFDILLEKNGGTIIPDGKNFLNLEELHPKLDLDNVRSLPSQTGIYYLYNESDEIIYIGKSKDIRKRILTHLGKAKAVKAQRMKKEVASVDFEVTGSELLALLREAEEIKKHKPFFNKAQRKSRVHYGIFSFSDRKGYRRFSIAKNDGRVTPLISFDSQKAAKDYLFKSAEKYNLCHKLCGLSDSVGACFEYQIKVCKGACVGDESASDYNLRVTEFVNSVSLGEDAFAIVDKGREEDEISIVLIENGLLKGFAYLSSEETIQSKEELSEILTPYHHNDDARAIIKKYISDTSALKIVRFSNE